MDASNPYLGLVQQDSADTIRQSLQTAVDRQPDTEARLQGLARQYQLPVEAVRLDTQTVERRARLDAVPYSEIVKSLPATGSLLSDPRKAAIAHDDIDNLGAMETLLNSFKRGVPALQSIPDTLLIKHHADALNEMDAVDKAVAEGQTLESGGMASAAGYYYSLLKTPEERARFRANHAEEMRNSLGESAASLAGLQAERQAIPSPGVVAGVLQAPDWSAAWHNFQQDPLRFIAAIGPESVVQSGPGMLAAIPAGIFGGPGGAAAAIGAHSALVDYAGELVGNLQAAGVDVTNPQAIREAVKNPEVLAKISEQAARHAGVVGGFDAVSGGIAGKSLLPKLVDSKLVGRPLAKEMANIALQLPVQAGLGAAGEAGGEIAAGQDLQPGNILAEAFGEFFGTPAEVAAASARRIHERFSQAGQAEQQAANIERINRLAAASKVLRRDPETMKAFVDAAIASVSPGTGENGGGRNLYIDAKAFMQTGVAEQVAAALPEVAEQLPAALASGGEIRIPLGDYMTKIAPAEYAQPLADHLRMDGEEFSRAGARQYMDRHGEELQAEMADVLRRRQDDAAWQASHDTVRNAIRQQLDALGRQPTAVNEQYATLMGSYFATMAGRLGVTPEALFKSSRLNFASMRHGMGFNQSAIDELINGAPTVVTGNEIADFAEPLDMKRLRQAAALYGDQHVVGTYENSKSGLRLEIRRGGINEALQHGSGPDKIMVIAAIPDIAVNGHVVYNGINLKNPQGGLVAISKRVDIAGKSFVVTAGFRKSSSGRLLYDHELLELRRVDGLSSQPGDGSKPNHPAPASTRLNDYFRRFVGKNNGFNQKRKTDEHTTDSFGYETAIPADARDHHHAETGSGGGLSRDDAPAGKYAAKTQIVTEQSRKLGTGKVTTGILVADSSNRRGHNAGTKEALLRDDLVKLYGEHFYRSGQRFKGFFEEYRRRFNPGGDDSRGGFDPATRTIILNKNADLSTFLHEAGHFFLEMQFDLASRLMKQEPPGDDGFGDGNAVLHQRWRPTGGEDEPDKDLPLKSFSEALAQRMFSENKDKASAQGAKPESGRNAWINNGKGNPPEDSKPNKADKADSAWHRARIPKIGLDAPPQEILPESEDDFGGDYVYEFTNNDLPPGKYAANTYLAVERIRRIGTDRVNSPEEAAQAFAYLSRYAAERFEALITDDEGTPLAIVGSMKGTRQSSPYFPETFAAEAFRIQGAANIWFAHNHPGGPAEFSYDDRKANAALSDAFFGSKIKPRGLLAIGGKKGEGRSWAYAPSHAKLYYEARGHSPQEGDLEGVTVAPVTVADVSVVELVFAAEGAIAPKIAYPIPWEETVKISERQTGILLLDMGSNPTAFVPIRASEADKLRKAGRMDALHRVLSMTNPSYAIIINHNDLVDDFLVNLAGFLNSQNVRVLDIFTVWSTKTKDEVRYGIFSKRRDLGDDQYNHIFDSARKFNQGPVRPGWFRSRADAGVSPEKAAPSGLTNASGRQRIIDDAQILLDWFGLKSLEDWHQLDFEQQRHYHEQFAEGFEAYLFEGKAPSIELQGLFERFKAWLLEIYRSIRALNADDLNAEVRGVFDRMLASEAEIGRAEQSRRMRPLFGSADEAGMSAAEFADYLALGRDATQAAVAALQFKGLRDMQWLRQARSRTLKKWQQRHDAMRREVREGVRLEIRARPVYRAWDFLVRKERGGKLDARGVSGLALPDRMVRRLRGLGMLGKAGGLHPDIAAELFGFSSGDELVKALAVADKPNDLVGRLTDERMLQNHGELATAQAVKRAADSAVHNRLRAGVVAAEADALAKASGQMRLLGDAAERYAVAMIKRVKLGDINPGLYGRAEARLAGASATAMKAGDMEQAAVEKREQLINLYAAMAAYRLRDEVEAGLRYLRRFGGSNDGLEPEHAGQIQALLERFGLGKPGDKSANRKYSLADWLKLLREQGLALDLAPELASEAYRVSYQDLAMEEFRGLTDAVRRLEHLGRMENRLLTVKNDRSFQSVAQEIVRGMDETAGTETPQVLRRFRAMYGRAALARIPEGGAAWKYFLRGAGERVGYEARRRAAAAEKLSAILDPVFKLGDMGGKGLFFPGMGRSFNREMRLAMALNTGNDGNLRRLLAGEGWDAGQIAPVLQTLGAEEWLAVQAIWDYFGSFRPEIAAKERRVYGREPEWIEPRPRLVSAKTASGMPVDLRLRGGYYPVRYDPFPGLDAEGQGADARADAGAGERQWRGMDTSGVIRRSFCKNGGAAVSGRPLLYSLSGVFSGVNEVIHDLAWHEWLIDMNRLLKSESIGKAMRRHYGADAVSRFKAWLEDIAGGDAAAVKAGEVALGGLRQSLGAAGLGFNTLSAAMRAQGFERSIARIGPFWLAGGIRRFISDPQGAEREVNGKSRFMHNRSESRFREPDESAVRPASRSGAGFMIMKAGMAADVTVWLAAYGKAIAAGNDEENSIALADQTVIGAGDGLGGGAAGLKAFALYHDYVNLACNSGAVPAMAGERLLLYCLPAVLGYFMKAAVTAGCEDCGWEDLSDKLRALQIDYSMGLMVIAGEFAAAAKTVAGMEIGCA